MRINWDTPVDVLIHSSNIRYIDLDPDEIMHWKYIKRDKLSSGKYRYYYDQSELDNAKAEMDRASQKLSTLEKFDAQLESAKGGVFNGFATFTLESDRYKKQMADAQEHAKQTAERYKKLSISSFLERTISKGIVKVANFFSDLSDKKK